MASVKPTEADLDDLDLYVAAIQAAMKLGHWSITVDRKGGETLEENVHGQIVMHDAYTRADVAFGDTFWSSDPAVRSHTVVHELAHCHVNPMHHHLMDLERQMSKEAARISGLNTLRSVERLTDAIADVVSQFVPPFITRSEHAEGLRAERAKSRVKVDKASRSARQKSREPHR